MKLKHLNYAWDRGNEVVARFGRAALVREPGGQWRLQGGTRDERSTAREWISLFMHEVVVSN